MIALIETKMIARLQEAADAGALGYKWGTLETYPEDWDELLKDSVRLRSPAAWVVFAGFGSVFTGDDGQARAEADFAVVVAAESLRNETAQRHGGPSAAEPGSYQLLLDAGGLLNGQDFDLDIDALELVSVRSVRPAQALRERKLSMYALQFRTALPIPGLKLGASDLADFATFHANWDIQGGRSVGASLPDDDGADATDHQELQS